MPLIITSLKNYRLSKSMGSNTGFVVALILYIVAANLFQILGISETYVEADNVWKTGVLFVLIIYSLYSSRRERAVGKWQLLALFALALYQALNVLFTENIPGSVGSISLIVFPVISVLLFLVILGKRSLDTIDVGLFMKLFIVFVVYSCIVNLTLNIDAITALLNGAPAYESSLSSFFNNRNTFGFYLLLGAISSIYLLANKPCLKMSDRVLVHASLILILVNLVLTLSRTSLVAFAVFLIMFLLLQKKYRFMTMLTVASLVVFGLSMNVPSVSSFIDSNIVRQDAGLSGREELYQDGFSLVMSSDPIFGLGYGQAQNVLLESADANSFHSAYLTIFASGGVILFTIFVFLIYYIASICLRLRAYNKFISNYFLSILIAYLAYSITESRVLFFGSVPDVVVTIFVVLLPVYVLNHYEKVRI